MVDMADGDIVAGDKLRKSTTTIVKDLAARAGALTNGRPRICRAMAQQRSELGESPMPQKFVRLVGCHDPKAGRAGGR
jgi:hypothetical protein